MASKPPPTRNGAASKPSTSTGVPNQTLYLTNLPEKTNKHDVKRALYMLFATYGPVLDIVVTRRGTMRGQGHVVFRDIATSTQAMRALQGFDFFGKDLKITYGKGQSHVIAKLRGTFEVPTPAQPAETTELHKSIFNAPPPSGVPAKVAQANGLRPAPVGLPPAPHGVKRPREEDEEEMKEGETGNEEDDEEEEEEEGGEASMDEDDESDAPMEGSSDDD